MRQITDNPRGQRVGYMANGSSCALCVRCVGLTDAKAARVRLGAIQLS
jgi:hypothetical protein